MKKHRDLTKKVVIATLMVAAVGGMSLPAPVHAFVNGAEVGADSVAIGTGTIGGGDYSIAMGSDVFAAGYSSIAIGTKSRAPYGDNITRANGDYSIALGTASEALAEHAIAMGQVSHVAENAKGGTAIGTGASVFAENGTAVGMWATSTGKNGTASGAFAQALGEESAALGHFALASEANSVALGAGSVTTAASTTNTQSATIGGRTYTFGGSTATGVVSVGGVGGDEYGNAVTNYRQIQNVANGAVTETSTDAVNGSQLYAVAQETANNNNAISSIGSTVTQLGSTVTQLGSTVTQLGSTVTQLGNDIHDLDNRMDKVGAGAAALAALHPLDFNPTEKWDFAAGYGHYSGAGAVAVGAYYRPNEDTMFSVGATLGNGENMWNAGFSVKIGQGNNMSTSRTVMAREIQDLKLRNQRVMDQNATVIAQNQQLRDELEAVKAQVAAMAKK